MCSYPEITPCIEVEKVINICLVAFTAGWKVVIFPTEPAKQRALAKMFDGYGLDAAPPSVHQVTKTIKDLDYNKGEILVVVTLGDEVDIVGRSFERRF